MPTEDDPGDAAREEQAEPFDALDEALTETFPASDPIAVFDARVEGRRRPPPAAV